MKATLDNALRNKIKESFEKYQPEYKPEYWQAFQAQNGAKAKKTPIIWTWVAKAAVIALFFSIIPQKLKHLPLYIAKTQISITNQAPVASSSKTTKKGFTKISLPGKSIGIAKVQLLHERQVPTSLLNSRSIAFTLKDKPQIKVLNNSYVDSYLLDKELAISENKKQKKQTNVHLGFGLSSASGANNSTGTNTFGCSLIAGLNITKKIAIQSGFSINRTNTAQKQQYILSSKQLAQINTKEEENLHYFSIPLIFSYRVKKNIALSISSSVDYINKTKNTREANFTNLASSSQSGYNIAQSVPTVNSTSSMTSTEKIRQFDALNNMKISVSYLLNMQKREVQVEPYMQIPIRKKSKSNNNTPLIGLNLRYNINLG